MPEQDMREKVIKGLECCSRTTAEPNCEECPYNKNKMDCDNDMMHDAIALLKAQEPRVMTLEEALGGDECWIEARDGGCGYCDCCADMGDTVLIYRVKCAKPVITSCRLYGKTWRCWTSRPDEKRREETPWKRKRMT